MFTAFLSTFLTEGDLAGNYTSQCIWSIHQNPASFLGFIAFYISGQTKWAMESTAECR